MASGSPRDNTPLAESLETNGAEDANIESQLPAEQVKAIKKVIDSLYAYREHEYAPHMSFVHCLKLIPL